MLSFAGLVGIYTYMITNVRVHDAMVCTYMFNLLIQVSISYFVTEELVSVDFAESTSSRLRRAPSGAVPRRHV